MHGSAAELDFMLQDAGVPVVFARGASTLASTFGLLDEKTLVTPGDTGLSIAGYDSTVSIRDGTQGAATLNDTATINGITFHIRDLGIVQADGMRTLTLARG